MRERVSDRVHDHLVDLVSSGRVPPGDRLPAERTLADDLGVSRPAVREAVQRLAAAGVVEVRQGDGTRVLEPGAGARTSASRPGLRDAAGRLLPDAVRALLDVRRVLLSGAAGIAAEVADPAGVDRLGQAVGDVAVAGSDHRVPAERRLWARLITIAANDALRTSVEGVTSALGELLDAPGAGTGSVSAELGDLLAAVATGRPAAARDAADAVLAVRHGQVLASMATD